MLIAVFTECVYYCIRKDLLRINQIYYLSFFLQTFTITIIYKLHIQRKLRMWFDASSRVKKVRAQLIQLKRETPKTFPFDWHFVCSICQILKCLSNGHFLNPLHFQFLPTLYPLLSQSASFVLSRPLSWLFPVPFLPVSISFKKKMI